MKRSDILDAWVFLRKKNHDIPDDVLDFMKNESLKAYDEMMKDNDAYLGCNSNSGVVSKKHWDDLEDQP